MPEHTQLRLLRLAGVDTEVLTQVLRSAAKDGCPGLRLLEKDGEYAVCIQARADSALSAAAICDTWERWLRPGLGDAVFTVGEKSLAETVVAACAAGQKLFVAADEPIGRLLEARLARVEDANAVFDFGSYSYAHPKKADRLEPPRWVEKKYPAQPIQKAVGRCLAVLKISGADYALDYSPAGGGQPAAALLCTPKEVWVVPMAEGDNQPAVAVTALLDLVRRRAGGLQPPAFAAAFAPGKPVPALEPPPAPRQPAAPAGPTRPVLRPTAEQTAQTQAELSQASQASQTARRSGLAAGIAAGIAAQDTAVLGEAPGSTLRPASRQPEEDAAVRLDGGQAPASQERMADAARSLFEDSDDAPDPMRPEAPSAGRILLCALLVAVVAGICALAVWLGQSRLLLGSRLPAFRSYGTADFDTAAQSYLLAARRQDSEAAAYLALSGQPGVLVYQQSAGSRDSRPGAVLAAGDTAAPQNGLACFAGLPTLGQAHSNTMLYCPAAALEGLGRLDEEDVLAQNCGFTLYDGLEAYRYKVAAVFYWDPAETGETAFALESLRDLSNYRDYLSFVLGIKARSLFEMPVGIAEGDTFATLVADAQDPAGGKLVVVGRQQRADETAILSPDGIVSALQPLYTAAQYAANGQQPPGMGPLAQYWMNWYLTGARTGGDLQESAGMPETDPTLDEVQQSGQEGAAPEDPNGPEDPEGDDPDATAAPDPSASPGPSASPSPSPTASAGPSAQPSPPPAGPTEAPTPVPTPEPTPTPPPAPPAGRTINVTMNGSAQTMDLVTCLAMIAQNELGYNQPAEAYKAQAVAAHSWILNQGGYPAVSGLSPSQAVLDAVSQVADLVITYNGSVAFTPYTASVAGGTCSSVDVWGGYKPYLVEVDSPYDAQYASNWQNVREYTADEVAIRAMDKEGVDLRACSEDPADWLGDFSATTYGYVRTLRLGDKTITGDRLRLGVLNNINGKSLRSTAFTVSYDAGRGVFVFTTRGYGHGCGLSQWGAVGYAHNGWGFADILAHYFPGTSLSNI